MTARILIVDDLLPNIRLLEAKLRADYYQIATAQTGSEAIRLTHGWQPDLILLDVMMPEMDGYETCRRLKADPATYHIPVVMLTALGEPTERLRGLESGADDFLTKPVEYETLTARVKSLARLKRLLDEWRLRGETARSLGLVTESPEVPSVHGARALVVDDWDLGAQATQDALAREGILPGRAGGEEEAMALTAAIPFDLIVLSLSMASHDPLRLASRLRAADATHDIPLLLIAEPEQRSLILKGFDLGANDWIVRPVDENELRVRARNQLRRKFYQDRLRADLGQAVEMHLTDPLTGFYNQRYLSRHLRGLMESEHRHAVSVLMLDVDHFRQLNERYGHAAGDRALRALAERLRDETRVHDCVVRYGGEEFVVVMPGVSAPDAAAAAERLRAAAEAMPFYPQPGVAQRLTVSVGVAHSGRPDITPEQIVQAADAALARAKHAGRNRVEVAG